MKKQNFYSSYRKVSMKNFEVSTVFVLHQRTYLRQYKFEPIAEATWRWLGSSLEILERGSSLNPLQISDMSSLDRGIKLISNMDEWSLLMRKELQILTAGEVIAAFNALEMRLGISDYSKYICEAISRYIRKFIVNHIEVQGGLLLARRVKKEFKSILSTKNYKGRALISDMPKPGRPPIGAISYESHSELKEATLNTLKTDLYEILECCKDTLNKYEKAQQYIQDIENMNISDANIERIKGKTKRRDKKNLDKNWSHEDLTIYLSMIKKEIIAQSAQGDKADIKKRFHPLGAKELICEGIQGMKNGAHIKDLMQIDIAPPTEMLLACALILQIHTGWNFISILELKYSDVVVKNLPHRLQSVKPRTSDQTPIVFVEQSDDLVLRSLTHLRERWERLVVKGIINNDQQNLWISARFIKGVEPHPVVSWGAELREFTKAYKLPAFSLEQVRVQCLAIVSMTRRGLSGATQSAGHISTNTTIRYIDKALLIRLNSSNLLEFERRLEKSVSYEIDDAATGNLLRSQSLGNGTQCTNPHQPPNPAWINAGICTGDMCHQGDGCPHLRIIIDKMRIEEIIRTKNYYLTNWKRLADANSVRFERVHAPQMLFGLALYGVVKKGPYRHLIAKFEK